MIAKPEPPKIPIRPHTYVPDFSDEALEWNNERRCAGCSQPKRSRVHDYTPPKDNTDRITGEGGE